MRRPPRASFPAVSASCLISFQVMYPRQFSPRRRGMCGGSWGGACGVLRRTSLSLSLSPFPSSFPLSLSFFLFSFGTLCSLPPSLSLRRPPFPLPPLCTQHRIVHFCVCSVLSLSLSLSLCGSVHVVAGSFVHCALVSSRSLPLSLSVSFTWRSPLPLTR